MLLVCFSTSLWYRVKLKVTFFPPQIITQFESIFLLFVVPSLNLSDFHLILVKEGGAKPLTRRNQRVRLSFLVT